jgi:hypothetical protein
MRLSIKIIVGAAVVAASVAVATFGASAPANASEALRAAKTDNSADLSARRKSARHHRHTTLRVSRLSRRAAEPPNPNRPYYRPVPHFYPFAQDRGFF